ncbi:MAG: hypothetical protein ABIG96_01405 [Candidatus Micrarchaeota archaeon]
MPEKSEIKVVFAKGGRGQGEKLFSFLPEKDMVVISGATSSNWHMRTVLHANPLYHYFPPIRLAKYLIPKRWRRWLTEKMVTDKGGMVRGKIDSESIVVYLEKSAIEPQRAKYAQLISALRKNGFISQKVKLSDGTLME